MSNLTTLIDQARMRLPGALDAAIFVELSSTLKEFFEQSNIWQERIEVYAVPGVVEYELDADTDYTTEFIRLMHVKNADGRVISASMETPGTIILATAPAGAETYYATVAKNLVATGSSPVVPDWIIGKHYNGLLDGLLGRMMSQLAKPYSNPRLAVVHLANFKRTMNLARKQATHQNIYSAQRWRFPSNFA